MDKPLSPMDKPLSQSVGPIHLHLGDNRWLPYSVVRHTGAGKQCKSLLHWGLETPSVRLTI